MREPHEVLLRLLLLGPGVDRRERAELILDRLAARRRVLGEDGTWFVTYEAGDVSEAMRMCERDLAISILPGSSTSISRRSAPVCAAAARSTGPTHGSAEGSAGRVPVSLRGAAARPACVPHGRRTDRINSRDLEVLDAIGRYGTVPRPALAAWAGTGRTVTYERERRLLGAGLIRVRQGFEDDERLLVATSLGLRACGLQELREARPSPATIIHEATAASLGLRLEGDGRRVLSEREMLAAERAAGGRPYSAEISPRRFHRPDLIVLEEGGGPAAIEVVYEGFGIDVAIRRYRRRDGTEVDRQVIDHPGSVAILAHDEEFVYLVAQPREVVEEDALLEIPAGTLDKAGEGELDCARRELAEEAELAAAEWTELTKIYPSPGFISEVVTIFLATGLSPASGERDEDEDIEIVRLPIAELGAKLPEIRDAATLIALMMLRDGLVD